jgi:soluble lytic murein transglycosylase
MLGAVLLVGDPSAALAQSSHRKKKKSSKPAATPCRTGCAPNTVAPEITAATPEDEAAQRELSGLARELRNAAPGAFEKLAAFSNKNAGNVWGARAALALGSDEYNKKHAEQASIWLAKAKADTLLGDHVLFLTAQSERSLGRTAVALTSLQTIEREYPNTALKEQVLEALAPAATESGKPQAAIEALDAYSGTSNKPALLLLRAQAYKANRDFTRAAKDYQTLFYKYPLTDEGKAAGTALSQIMKTLGKEYPYPGVELQQERAQAFFNDHQWREARAEFEKLLGMLRDPANPHRQLAQLRIAQARVEMKSSPSLIAKLQLSDANVDAERLYVLSQAYRSEKKEQLMFATLEELERKYPSSKSAEDGLMSQGNYYWVNLDRNKAAVYYQQILDKFPGGKNAFYAEWRTAWVAYLNRQPNADDRLAGFLKEYPASANAPDALYWLGRSAERGGNSAHARAYFRTDVERFPETYFGHAAALRLEKLGPGEEQAPEFLASIPPPPPLRAFDDPIPPAAVDRWLRAQALRIIAFDAAAEQELKSAYFATGSPRLLFEAAQAAFDQGHFASGMAYGRLAVPNFDSRKFSEVPVNVWRVLYPLPYEAALRREAARNNFDPMLAAGLIRQESTFQADAVSHKDAIGLMQVLPKTGKLLAKQLRVRYSKNMLFEPDYNIELGMLYISNLVRTTGAAEYALAAFNAGEDRIAAWRAERQYEEIPELVESIPFSETRDYVQIVSRNAEMYRMIYGVSGGPSSSAGILGPNKKNSQTN